MDIMQLILDAQGGGAARQLGNQFGLDSKQTQSALGALLPALAGAVRQNTQKAGGLESLLGALSGGQHARALDQADALGDPRTVDDGNGILGHLLGSKEVSRAVASRASQQTGIGADVLKRMLPLVASMMMAGLAKGAQAGQSGGQGGLGGLAGMLGGAGGTAPGGGLLDMLTPMLDQNKDGSALDDVMKMAAGFLGRR